MESHAISIEYQWNNVIYGRSIYVTSMEYQGPSVEHRGIQHRSGGMIARLFAKCLPTARGQNIALDLSLNFAKRPSAPHHPCLAQMLIAAYRFCSTCAGDCDGANNMIWLRQIIVLKPTD